MADIKAIVKLQILGGAASPANVGTALGPQGINMMDFCKAFNAQTAQKKGETVPVIVTILKNRTFTFVLKTAPTSELIKKKLNLKKGSGRPNTEKLGMLKQSDLEEIAKIKMPDLNAIDIDAAKKVVAGTARSMGVEIGD
ncbi:MAG: 50S ribosomal protein L11 [Proteobacteria bacterium]|jgi:large subunit ribosomal protein L11|nr:50S ribosomal protein L11 [Pseudomonadota bacterium]NBP15030.1 50S ribosomal protein L11 [bacterium]